MDTVNDIYVALFQIGIVLTAIIWSKVDDKIKQSKQKDYTRQDKIDDILNT